MSQMTAANADHLRILVCIAYYGTENEAHIRTVIDEYQTLPHEIDIVVISEAIKDLDAVELVVGLPTSNPYSLPFAHKWVFAERVDDYDLFIYSEDDTLVRAANIEAFRWASSVLPEDHIAGFLRTEVTPTDERRCSSAHNHFHWDPESLLEAGGELFAQFTNPHGACYMLTQAQLRRCIETGEYLTAPREGRYDMRVTAATDPYTVCGLRKMICIGRIDDFLLPHLTNKYTDMLGAPYEQLLTEINALSSIWRGELPKDSLFDGSTGFAESTWDKKYHEPAHPFLLDTIPPSSRRVLSIGAGSGALERALSDRGHLVSAIPIDSVVGAVLQHRGIEATEPSFDGAFSALAGRRFDAIVLSSTLQHLTDPVDVLRRSVRLLDDGGLLIATVPNLDRVRLRHFLGKEGAVVPTGGPEVRFIAASGADVRRWFLSAGLATVDTAYVGGDRPLPGPTARAAASVIRVVGRKRRSRVKRVLTDAPGPRVSIGLPVYNGDQYLETSLDALRAQTFEDIEIVISDNASIDATEQICREAAAQDPRIRYYRHEVNRGAAFNYNFAFAASRGEYFCWTAHDDIRHPRNIQRCLHAFESGPGSLVLVATSAVSIGPDGEIVSHDDDDNSAMDARPANRLTSVLDNINQANSVWGLARSSALERTNLIGPFIASDYVLLAELSLIGQIKVLDEQLFSRRVHDGSSRRANRSDAEVARWFDAGAARPTLSARQRLAVEYWRAIERSDMPVLDAWACRLAVPTRMLRRRVRARGGLAKRWVAEKTGS